MAQVKATFEEVPEIIEIAKKLIEKHQDFSAIDISKIKAVAVNNKERSEKKRIWEIVSSKPPMSTYCSCQYCIVVYLSDWTEMPEIVKNKIVAAALWSIVPDEEGKLKPFDLKDHAVMVKTFGVDWQSIEGSVDPLAQDFKWKF